MINFYFTNLETGQRVTPPNDMPLSLTDYSGEKPTVYFFMLGKNKEVDIMYHKKAQEAFRIGRMTGHSLDLKDLKKKGIIFAGTTYKQKFKLRSGVPVELTMINGFKPEGGKN